MRKNIVAGNWKMNTDLADTQELIGGLKKIVKTFAGSLGEYFINKY